MNGHSDEASSPGSSGRLQRHRRLALASLMATSLLAALGLSELAVRWIAPQPYYYAPPFEIARDAWRGGVHRRSALPGLRYELAPNANAQVAGAQVQTNGYGMRDAEPLPAETPGLWRIAVFGDSVTFGYGVAGDESYASVLEAELVARPLEPGRRSDVLNFGVSGYSSQDEAAQIEHVVSVWRPRLVIVGYTLNDPETEPFQPLQAYYQEAHAWQYSHALRLLHRARREAAVRRLGGGDYLRYLHADPGKWGSVLDAFARIARAAAAVEAEVLVVIFPTILEPERGWEEYPHAGLHRQIADAARAAGLDALDLLPDFAATPPARLRVSPSDGHPNAFAHALAARAIATHLRRRAPRALR